MNVPVTYQKAMNKILDGLPFVQTYPDDIMIFSKAISEHLEHIGDVLDRISRNNLKLKITKCEFIQE